MPEDDLIMFAMKMTKMATGEIYFQQIIQNRYGRLPVIYSMSLLNLYLQYKKKKTKTLIKG